MKRLILGILLFACLPLSACSFGGDMVAGIGVIGGADGPTDVYVNGNKKEDEEKKPVRMLRIDGELYYDSGKVSDITGRCGNMDGTLEKTADEFEIPRGDGECNFDGTDGYQLGQQEATKEVLLDGKWIIFRRISDPEKDLSDYRYCYDLKGTMPNAEGETEMIILANDRDLSFQEVTKSLYGSLLEDYRDFYWIEPE